MSYPGNALDIIHKIQNGKIDLADVKNNQEKFKPYLEEIKKKETKNINQKSKKTLLQYWSVLQSKKRSY